MQLILDCDDPILLLIPAKHKFRTNHTTGDRYITLQTLSDVLNICALGFKATLSLDIHNRPQITIV